MLKGKSEQSNRGRNCAISPHQRGEGAAGTDAPWINSRSFGGFEFQQSGGLRPRNATPWLRAACAARVEARVLLAVRNRRYAFATRLCNPLSRAYECRPYEQSSHSRGPEEVSRTSLPSTGDVV